MYLCISSFMKDFFILMYLKHRQPKNRCRKPYANVEHILVSILFNERLFNFYSYVFKACNMLSVCRINWDLKPFEFNLLHGFHVQLHAILQNVKSPKKSILSASCCFICFVGEFSQGKKNICCGAARPHERLKIVLWKVIGLLFQQNENTHDFILKRTAEFGDINCIMHSVKHRLYIFTWLFSISLEISWVKNSDFFKTNIHVCFTRQVNMVEHVAIVKRAFVTYETTCKCSGQYPWKRCWLTFKFAAFSLHFLFSRSLFG